MYYVIFFDERERKCLPGKILYCKNSKNIDLAIMAREKL